MALGNYDQAKSSVDTFVQLEEESPSRNEHWSTIWWMSGASILAKIGDRQSFTNYCNKMFLRFPIPNEIIGERVAKGALMMDSNPRIIKDALEYTLTANSLRKGEGFYHWSCFSVGLGYFRSGDMKNAELKCNESLDNSTSTHPWLPGLNNALLSMIY